MRCAIVIIACLSAVYTPGSAYAGGPALAAGLIEAMDDPDNEVRQNLAMALANLGEEAVPALLEALGDPDPRRRAGAAMALGQIRPAPRSAIPGLMAALKDRDDGVRRQVSYALSRMVRKASPDTLATSDPLANVPPPDPTPKLP